MWHVEQTVFVISCLSSLWTERHPKESLIGPPRCGPSPRSHFSSWSWANYKLRQTANARDGKRLKWSSRGGHLTFEKLSLTKGRRKVEEESQVKELGGWGGKAKREKMANFQLRRFWGGIWRWEDKVISAETSSWKRVDVFFTPAMSIPTLFFFLCSPLSIWSNNCWWFPM